jgi:hypothetical protein
LGILDADNPENTKKAYNPKIREYAAFCDFIYPNEMHRHVLCKDKVYLFMYYQSFLEKKKVGGRISSPRNKPDFDAEAYNMVMSTLISPGAGDNPLAYPTLKILLKNALLTCTKLAST